MGHSWALGAIPWGEMAKKTKKKKNSLGCYWATTPPLGCAELLGRRRLGGLAPIGVGQDSQKSKTGLMKKIKKMCHLRFFWPARLLVGPRCWTTVGWAKCGASAQAGWDELLGKRPSWLGRAFGQALRLVGPSFWASASVGWAELLGQAAARSFGWFDHRAAGPAVGPKQWV